MRTVPARPLFRPTHVILLVLVSMHVGAQDYEYEHDEIDAHIDSEEVALHKAAQFGNPTEIQST